MKKSELKEIIKSAMLEETSVSEAEKVDEGLLDFLKKKKEAAPVKKEDPNPIIGVDYDGNYIRKDGTMAEAMTEAEEVDVEDNEEVDVDIEKDVEIDDESVESDIEVDASMPGESADEVAVQSLLMKAQEEAAKLGDEKLTDQIGNTITYFTRAHVAQVDENKRLKESKVRRGEDGLITKLL